MQLLLMRHGMAEAREEWHQDDALRPLSEVGERRTKRAAKGLTQIIPSIDLVATSPLIRATQTAAFVKRAYHAEVQTWPELEEAEFDGLCARLREIDRLDEKAVILLVGHEPGMSDFTSRLLSGKSGILTFEFKKASVCCLQVDFAAQKPRAELRFFATPKMLRSLAE